MAQRKEYSGPFIWMAMACIIMPVFLIWQGFARLPQPVTYPTIEVDASGVDLKLWDHLVRTYVAAGLVDYDGLGRNYQFKQFVRQLAEAQPDQLQTDAQRLALLCNAYNAFVINGVLIHNIHGSVLDYKDSQGRGFFDVPEHVFAGKLVSLNHLEHEVIRREFAEPRIHVALVCAARSCPAIRPEAYFPGRLEDQLADQAHQFANDSQYVSFDSNARVLTLSSILDWYKQDFGGLPGVLDFLAARTQDPLVLQGIEAVKAGQAEVKFAEYDWTLNTQGSTSGGGGHAGFGSGSVPNE